MLLNNPAGQQQILKFGLLSNLFNNLGQLGKPNAQMQDPMQTMLNVNKMNSLMDGQKLRQEQAEQAAKLNQMKIDEMQRKQDFRADLGRSMGDPDSMQAIGQEYPLLMQEYEQGRFGGDSTPSAVREWNFYNNLPPEDRTKYLSLKRADKYLDLGDRVIQTTPGAPGQVSATFNKELPPQETPKVLADQEIAKKKAAAGVEKERLYPKMRDKLSSLERQWDILDQTINTAIKQTGPFTTGPGSLISGVPGTPQKDLAETLNTIKANIGFDKLQDMRDNSPTGGALGQVSELENKLLQAVQGSLEQGQSKAQLTNNLLTVKKLLGQLREQKRQAFTQDFGQYANSSPEQQIKQDTPNNSVDDLLKKYGVQ